MLSTFAGWLAAHRCANYAVMAWLNFALAVFFLWVFRRARRERDEARNAAAAATREIATLKGATSFRDADRGRS